MIGVKTGHTSQAGWSQVAAVRSDVGTIYVTILGSPSRTQRNADLQTLLAWGISQYRMVDAIDLHEHLRARRSCRTAAARSTLVAAKPLRLVVRPGHPLVQKVIAPVVARPAGASAGRSSGACRCGRARSCSGSARSSPPGPSTGRG